MAKISITREEIKRVLTRWQRGELTTEEVRNWASQSFFPGETDYDDWEGDDSVANEVLCTLDSLDMNLVLPMDVPIYLEFLGTSLGKFLEGFAKWQAALEAIDMKERCKQLRADPIYRPFCR